MADIWIVNCDFGSGYENIGPYCSTLSKKTVLYNGLKSTINTCNFTVNDLTTANKFNVTTNDIPLQITKNGTAWFTGLIRPTYSNTVKSTFLGLTVQGYDKGILLNKLISPCSYTDIPVSDPTNKAASLLHQLFYSAGFVDAELSLSSIPSTTQFVVDIQDAKSYTDELNTLLFDFGYIYNIGADGIVRVYDLFPTSISPVAKTDKNFLDSLAIQRVEHLYDTVKIHYFPVVTKTGIVVFSDTSGGNDTNKANISLASGAYYPTGADAHSVYADYAITDYTVIKVSNAVLNMEATGTVNIDTFTPQYRRAQLQLHATTAAVITKLDITGDALLLDTNNETINVCYVTAGSYKVQDYTATYVHTKSDADRLSSGLAYYYGYQDFTYKGTYDGSISVGDYIEITEGVMGIVTNLRITSISEDEYGTQTFEADGISAFTVTGTSESSTYSPPDIPPSSLIDISNVINSSIDVYAGTESFDCSFDAFVTRWSPTVPSKLSIISDSTVDGGHYLKCLNGRCDLYGSIYMPVNEARAIYESFKIRRVSGTATSYMGYKCYDKDKNLLSIWWYPVGVVNPSATFVQYTGYTKGSGTNINGTLDPLSPSPYRAGTKYLRLYIILNYEGGTCETHLNFINWGLTTEATNVIIAGDPGTPIPTVPVINSYAAVNAIKLVWDKQNNLRWLDHYELQVSNDLVNWYSLQNNGTDWKATLNATTVVTTETYEHKNIPFAGTVSDPQGVSLYYRVRRVTTNGALSSFSAASNSSTMAISGGFLAKNIISASKLSPKDMPSLANDVLLYWPMEDIDKNGTGTNDLTPDISGNGHNGSVAGVPSTAKGRAGDAILLNGTSQSVNSGTYTLGSGLAAGFATSVWFNTSNISLTNQAVCVIYKVFLIRVDAGIVLAWLYDGAFTLIGATPPAVTNNSWHHIVVCWDGAFYSLYFDGSLVTSNAYTISSFADAQLQVGTWGGGSYFTGMIDEVRFYSRPLTLAEVQYLYNHPTGDIPPMIVGDRIVARSILAVNLDVDIINALIANINDRLVVSSLTGFTTYGLAGTTPAIGDTRVYLDTDEVNVGRITATGTPNDVDHATWSVDARLTTSGGYGRLELDGNTGSIYRDANNFNIYETVKSLYIRTTAANANTYIYAGSGTGAVYIGNATNYRIGLATQAGSFYTPNATYKISVGGAIHMNGLAVDYASQFHCNDNGRGSMAITTKLGSLPGYPTDYYPVIYTSYTALYMAINGVYTGYFDAAGGYHPENGGAVWGACFN